MSKTYKEKRVINGEEVVATMANPDTFIYGLDNIKKAKVLLAKHAAEMKALKAQHEAEMAEFLKNQ